MNRFFRYLEARRGTISGPGPDDESRDNKLEELKALWEAGVPPDVPSPPDVDRVWQRLQIRISRAERTSRGIRAQSAWRLPDWSPVRIAAAGGVGFAIILALILVPRLLTDSYQTGSEGQLTVTLPDSSAVTLCENSSFSVQKSLFGGSKRMRLAGGGLFSVKPQQAPFIVETAIGSIRVVGTQFDVRCDSRQLYVAVSHGTVAVSSTSRGVDSTVFVRKGEFVSCLAGGEPGAPKKSLTSGGPMWLSGVMTFVHADLHSVCDEISRQLGVRITLNNSGLDTLRVTGLIKGRDPGQILAALCELTGTTYRVEKDGYVVY
jgi:ferric-dicitrate binding protein FerR (iron transport regulator)